MKKAYFNWSSGKDSAFALYKAFPLWNSKPRELLQEFISLGFKSIVTCVDGSMLDESFAGRIIVADRNE